MSFSAEPYASFTEEACPPLSLVTVLDGGLVPDPEFIQSVLQQSFREWEWLVLLPSLSPAVPPDWVRADPRIRVLDVPPGTDETACRNQAVRESRGGLLAFLAPGERFEPAALEKWFWCLHAQPVCPWVTGSVVYEGPGPGRDELAHPFGFRFPSGGCSDRSFMVRRSVLDTLGGYRPDLPFPESQQDLWQRAAAKGFWGLRLPEYHRRSRLTPHERDPFGGAEAGEEYMRTCLRHRPEFEVVPYQPEGYFAMPTRVPARLPARNVLANERPRLLLVLPYLFVGGAEKVSLDIVSQLAARGWDITVVATDDARHIWLNEFLRHTSDVFVLQHFLSPIGCLADYPRFFKYLAVSRRPDVVLLANSAIGYGLLESFRQWLPQAALADVRHAENWPTFSQDFDPHFDLRIASFARLRDRMLAAGSDERRLTVCHTNVDTRIWKPDPARRAQVRGELGIPESVPVVVYAARLVESKQPTVFAATMRNLRDQGIPFVSLVIGDGPLLDWLETFVANYDLNDQIRLLRIVPAEQLPGIVASGDVAFLPTRQEGISMTAFEAMACGLPFVSADVGGMAELIVPSCGTLIESADPAVEVARYTEILADLLTRPEERQRKGQASLARIQQGFRLEDMGERVDGLLRDAATRRRSYPAASDLDGTLPSSAAATVLAMYFARNYGQLERELERARCLAFSDVKPQRRERWNVRSIAVTDPAAGSGRPEPRTVALDVTPLIGQPPKGIQRVISELLPRLCQLCWDRGITVVVGHSLVKHFQPIHHWSEPLPSAAIKAALREIQQFGLPIPRRARWIAGGLFIGLKLSGLLSLARRTPLKQLSRDKLLPFAHEMFAAKPVAVTADDAFVSFALGTTPVHVPPEIDPRRVVLVLHDLIPLRQARYVSADSTICFGHNLLPIVLGSARREVDFRVVTPSASTVSEIRHLYEDLGCPTPAVEVIPWGVDRTRFYPDPDPEFRRRLDIPADALVVLAIGTVDPRKRFGKILAAVRLLYKRLPVYGVFIGPEEAPGTDDSRVRFLGQLDDDSLRQAYSSCDAYVDWSACERSGLPILEALACGARVILPPDSPTLCEVGGKNVRIAAGATVEGLRATLLATLAEPQLDRSVPDLSRFDWDRTARAFAERMGLTALEAAGTPVKNRKAA